MSALLVLALAASDLSPPAVEGSPEPDPGAEVSFVVLESLNGAWVGLNTCGALGCFEANQSVPLLGGVGGAAAGFALACLRLDLASDWGRAALMESAAAAASLGSLYVASRPFWRTVEHRYLVAAGLDVALTVGVAALAPHVAPPPAAVWLADSLALWGALVGALAASLTQPLPQDQVDLAAAGAAAGGLVGGLMAWSTQRMTPWRFWRSNVGALLGGLLLGGGLFALELRLNQAGQPFDRTVPLAGAAAGIAGGFLVGFAFSEERQP